MLTEEQLHERFPWTAELAFNTSMTKKDVDEKTVPDGVVLLGYKTEKGVEKVHRFNTCAATPAPAACTTPVSGSLAHLVGLSGNNAGEILPKLLMAKLQMIESGVAYGQQISRLLWNPNLRLSHARRTRRSTFPTLQPSRVRLSPLSAEPEQPGTWTSRSVERCTRWSARLSSASTSFESPHKLAEDSPYRTFSPPSDQARVSLTAPAPLDGTQDPAAGHQGGGPQEVEEEGRSHGCVDHHQAQEEAEGVDHLVRGLGVPGALPWVLIVASSLTWWLVARKSPAYILWSLWRFGRVEWERLLSEMTYNFPDL